MEPAEAVVTWNDLAAAARRRAVRSRVWLLLVPVCLLLVVLAVVVDVVAVRVLAVVLVAYVGSIPLWGPTMATWLQARRRPLPPRPTRWVVTGEGLAVETEAGQSTLPSATLTEATSWRRGVSLTYGRAVAFVPRRAFRSAEHRQEFVTAVQTLAADDRS